MRTTWGTRPPWGSSTPSRLLTILICTTTPTPLWSWCLSSSKTCAGSKRSFIMRRGYGLPLFLYVFHFSLVFLFLSLPLKDCFLRRSLLSVSSYEGIPSWHPLWNCLCWTCEQFTFFAYSRSEKVFGDHLLRSGRGMSVKSECWTPTFCTRPPRNCSTCRCKLRVDRWAVTHLNIESSSILTEFFFKCTQYSTLN